MGLFGDRSYYQKLYNARQKGMTGGRITGDTGLTAFEFASKFQQVGGAGSHVYEPRTSGGDRGYVSGWGEMPLKDAIGLSAAMDNRQSIGTVGGAGMPITTGIGTSVGKMPDIIRQMFAGKGAALGEPPTGDMAFTPGQVVMLGGLAWIVYKVLL